MVGASDAVLAAGGSGDTACPNGPDENGTTAGCGGEQTAPGQDGCELGPIALQIIPQMVTNSKYELQIPSPSM